MPRFELPWLAEARKHIGLREVVGVKHQPVIQRWLAELGAWWRDDETPWCGVFAAHCVQLAGYPTPKNWMRAKAWADYRPDAMLSRPAYGCIVVFGRVGGGHVGFVVGRDPVGRLMVLGGNQGNQVSIRAFDPSRVMAYVWPGQSWPDQSRYELPLISHSGEVSVNER